MKTWMLGAAAAAAVVLAGLANGRLAADPRPDKIPEIEEIMQKVNKGKDALHAVVGKDLQAASVDWSKVQKETKEYVALAEFLGKNDPPKGDKASWAKLTKAYAENAKALNEAAQKQDKSGALAVHKKIQGSCRACHTAHREM